jgi:hypothetical protein
MANDNVSGGFRPVRNLRGGFIRIGKYTIASAYNTALHRGVLVNLTGTGRNIQIATVGAGNLTLGVFRGCSYKNSSGEFVYRPYWPASTVASNVVAYVWDDPQTVFRAVCATGTSLAAANIGLNASPVAGNGNDATGNSGWLVDLTTLGTGATLQLKLLGLSDTTNSDFSRNAYGDLAKVDVLLNQSALFATGVAGQ